jgi:hypothetical protein
MRSLGHPTLGGVIELAMRDDVAVARLTPRAGRASHGLGTERTAGGIPDLPPALLTFGPGERPAESPTLD